LEEVIHVLALGSDGFDFAGVIGIGRTENDTFAPGNSKENPTAGGHDDSVLYWQTSALDHQVDALGEAQADVAVREASGPGTGSINDSASADSAMLAGEFVLEVANPKCTFAAAVYKPEVIEEQSIVVSGGTQGVEDEASIVREGIEIADRASELRRVEFWRPIHHFVTVKRG
jgi:hypothetical protein